MNSIVVSPEVAPKSKGAPAVPLSVTELVNLANATVFSALMAAS
jgi:hypothetical protein